MSDFPDNIKLVLGIGNSAIEFRNTYHNAGLLALERCAAADGAISFRHPARKSFSYAKGARFIFAQSLTFMNESGTSAREACAFFKIRPDALLVLHDESDLPVGTFKCVFGGGGAGHKGIASITEALRTNDFWRFRIGIRPLHETRRRKAGEFVLAAIQPKDSASLERAFTTITSLLRLGSESH